jgi:membrane protease YdiL (CAAX protease family)
MLVIAVAFEGGLAVLAVFVCWLQDRSVLESFHWNPLAAGYGALAALPLLSLLVLGIWFPQGPLGRLLKVLDQYVLPLFQGCRLIDLVLISVLAGLGEEIFFRVAVQQWLARDIGGPAGPWVGLAASAAVFGAAHWVTPTYGVIAALIGLYLGGLWLWTGNLLVPIGAHALYDFLVLAYLVKIRRPAA